ncbi:alanine racemase [Heliophilum fasciatum]|uniref:Diaminopimelate decarboxylase n=1 Tax=Heliophilum fasciatum TaxID=35700 RepID=A0A4R2RZE3_9FIRM|nr:alanine racemase [Heliophilum fasciatum]MCW2277106.1 diaminopimelate decarboxylase [Heliophilum fasciatum]TCP68257.1 diaminopimelate decarboxylase [Heliophilum fasciatum]
MNNRMLQSVQKKYNKTPFYLFDEQGFINNYNEMLDAFRAIYTKYQISYSYKTNYTPYICNLVKRLGGHAEVVSDMEYELARKLGYPEEQIVFNGPVKGARLEEHLENGGIINIDNYDEAKRICDYATLHIAHQYKVGLRINLDVSGVFISRFGFEPESEELHKTTQLLKDHPNIQLVGLHCHISRARGIEAWRKRVEIMLKATEKYIDGVPEYISLGSGMFGKMPEALEAQFGSNIPTYKDYAKAVIKPIADHYSHIPEEKKPILYTEPGTTIVARYISFVTKILNIKTIRGRNMATVDGSYLNVGEICTLKNLPVIVKESGQDRHHYDAIDIMGFTCLEQDCIYKDYSGELAVGDILTFENVGGYSIVSKPQFIKPNSPMFSVNKEYEVKEIMREETFDDVFSKFNL